METEDPERLAASEQLLPDLPAGIQSLLLALLSLLPTTQLFMRWKSNKTAVLAYCQAVASSLYSPRASLSLVRVHMPLAVHCLRFQRAGSK